jgi:hypothetical protein
MFCAACGISAVASNLRLSAATGTYVNFAPRFPPYQLCFPFAETFELEPLAPWERLAISRSTYFAHRRLRRAVAAAFELGKRRRRADSVLHLHTPPAKALRPFCPNPAEACELRALATRVARLSISRTKPEFFFEEKDEIAHALRTISRRHQAA